MFKRHWSHSSNFDYLVPHSAMNTSGGTTLLSSYMTVGAFPNKNVWIKRLWPITDACWKLHNTHHECPLCMENPNIKRELCSSDTWSHTTKPRSCGSLWRTYTLMNILPTLGNPDVTLSLLALPCSRILLV